MPLLQHRQQPQDCLPEQDEVSSGLTRGSTVLPDSYVNALRMYHDFLSYEPDSGEFEGEFSIGLETGLKSLWNLGQHHPQIQNVRVEIVLRGAALEARESPLISLEEEFEDSYQRIGRWVGQSGSSERRGAELRFWNRWDATSIRWLLNRVNRSTDVDAASRVAGILSELGLTALSPILKRLNDREDQPSFEQAYTMLLALAWTDRLHVQSPSAADAREAISHYLLESDDAALREQAVAALSVLPRAEAVTLAQQARSQETGADVLEALEDKLEEL